MGFPYETHSYNSMEIEHSHPLETKSSKRLIPERTLIDNTIIMLETRELRPGNVKAYRQDCSTQ